MKTQGMILAIIASIGLTGVASRFSIVPRRARGDAEGRLQRAQKRLEGAWRRVRLVDSPGRTLPELRFAEPVT